MHNPVIKDTRSPFFSITQTDIGFIGKNDIIKIQLKKSILNGVASSGYAYKIFCTIGAKQIQAVVFNIYEIERIKRIINLYFV